MRQEREHMGPAAAPPSSLIPLIHCLPPHASTVTAAATRHPHLNLKQQPPYIRCDYTFTVIVEQKQSYGTQASVVDTRAGEEEEGSAIRYLPSSLHPSFPSSPLSLSPAAQRNQSARDLTTAGVLG